jgi:hypothetical protein
MPKTHASLKTIGALEDKYLSVLFVDFFAEICPPHLLLPLLDSYLFEGELNLLEARFICVYLKLYSNTQVSRSYIVMHWH